MGATVYTHPDLLKDISIDTETSYGLNSFFHVHVQTSLYILEITKQLCESINFDFVIYDIFGAGELVKEYLQIPGIVSSPIFLIPTEFLETLPFHPNAEIPFQPDEISEQSLYRMEHEFGVKPKTIFNLCITREILLLCTQVVTSNLIAICLEKITFLLDQVFQSVKQM